jgi:plasmid stabilization system protein ParE
MEFTYLYISEHLAAPKAADDLMADIETSIMRLKEFPYSGSPVQDDILRSRGYRKLITNNYIVFHLIDEIEKQVGSRPVGFSALILHPERMGTFCRGETDNGQFPQSDVRRSVVTGLVLAAPAKCTHPSLNRKIKSEKPPTLPSYSQPKTS